MYSPAPTTDELSTFLTYYYIGYLLPCTWYEFCINFKKFKPKVRLQRDLLKQTKNEATVSSAHISTMSNWKREPLSATPSRTNQVAARPTSQTRLELHHLHKLDQSTLHHNYTTTLLIWSIRERERERERESFGFSRN